MLCVCIAIIIDIIAWDLCITRLKALIFINSYPLNWADYTINIYPEIRDIFGSLGIPVVPAIYRGKINLNGKYNYEQL